jgi:hypothetical protein
MVKVICVHVNIDGMMLVIGPLAKASRANMTVLLQAVVKGESEISWCFAHLRLVLLFDNQEETSKWMAS